MLTSRPNPREDRFYNLKQALTMGLEKAEEVHLDEETKKLLEKLE